MSSVVISELFCISKNYDVYDDLDDVTKAGVDDASSLHATIVLPALTQVCKSLQPSSDEDEAYLQFISS